MISHILVKNEKCRTFEMIKKCFFVIFMNLLLLQSLEVVADTVTIELSFEPDINNGRQIYETCATCHLPEGWGNSDGTYPQIAGQHQHVLIRQLLAIRKGERENPTMYPFVQERTIGGYQSLADVVTYISTLPMHPRHTSGPWKEHTDEYDMGKLLYQNNCAECHGKEGEGDNSTLIPRLHGQHYPYLLRQIQLVKNKKRNVNPAMTAIVSHMIDQDLKKILNYVSYLPVPKEDVAPSITWRNTDFY